MNSGKLALVGLVLFKMSVRRLKLEVREFFGRSSKRSPREPIGNDITDKISPECGDIVAVIGSRIRLTKRGSRYAGCCPFHNDRVPSMVVIPETEFFLCFGCRAEGDAKEFVRRFDARCMD
jgi:CHC2-type zinc finger protein